MQPESQSKSKIQTASILSQWRIRIDVDFTTRRTPVRFPHRVFSSNHPCRPSALLDSNVQRTYHWSKTITWILTKERLGQEHKKQDITEAKSLLSFSRDQYAIRALFFNGERLTYGITGSFNTTLHQFLTKNQEETGTRVPISNA